MSNEIGSIGVGLIVIALGGFFFLKAIGAEKVGKQLSAFLAAAGTVICLFVTIPVIMTVATILTGGFFGGRYYFLQRKKAAEAAKQQQQQNRRGSRSS